MRYTLQECRYGTFSTISIINSLQVFALSVAMQSTESSIYHFTYRSPNNLSNYIKHQKTHGSLLE